MRRKHWSWFSFNNLIDLLKPTGPSKPEHYGLIFPHAYWKVSWQLNPLPSAFGPTVAQQTFQGLTGRKPSVRFPENISYLKLIYPFSCSWECGLVFRELLYFIYSLKDIATQMWTYVKKMSWRGSVTDFPLLEQMIILFCCLSGAMVTSMTWDLLFRLKSNYRNLTYQTLIECLPSMEDKKVNEILAFLKRTHIRVPKTRPGVGKLPKGKYFRCCGPHGSCCKDLTLLL